MTYFTTLSETGEPKKKSKNTKKHQNESEMSEKVIETLVFESNLSIQEVFRKTARVRSHNQKLENARES